MFDLPRHSMICFKTLISRSDGNESPITPNQMFLVFATPTQPSTLFDRHYFFPETVGMARLGQ